MNEKFTTKTQGSKYMQVRRFSARGQHTRPVSSHTSIPSKAVAGFFNFPMISHSIEIIVVCFHFSFPCAFDLGSLIPQSDMPPARKQQGLCPAFMDSSMLGFVLILFSSLRSVVVFGLYRS